MAQAPRFLVIPAAGLGTRMKTVDPRLPKEMLPIGGKPAIQYIVEEGFSAGIVNIVMIIRKGKDIIRTYFEDAGFMRETFPDAGEERDVIMNACTFSFLYQSEPLGESDALSYARDIVGNSSVAVIYPDNIYLPAPGALLALKEVLNRYDQDVSALMEVDEKNAEGVSNSGQVDLSPLTGNVFRIKRILPKGQGPFVPRFRGELRTCGISITGPHLFDYVERARPMVTKGEFTDVPVRELMLKERTLLGVRLPGRVFDVGNQKGYELCLRYLKNQRIYPC